MNSMIMMVTMTMMIAIKMSRMATMTMMTLMATMTMMTLMPFYRQQHRPVPLNHGQRLPIRLLRIIR